jgi:hypothetical protein
VVNQDSNGHRPLAPVLPTSEDAFVAALNRELAHRTEPLRASDTIRDVLDSLEIVVVWAWLDDLGAELPPGIERTVVTVSDLYEHAGFRWEAEGRVP